MKLTTHSDVPVYTVAGSSTARPLPEWLIRKRKRSLKTDPDFANRVELLQDFEFEEASSCVRVSEDGNWLMSTGTYKPQIHAHHLPHLSLSFARHTDALNCTFLLLSSDYSKSIHLQSDRYVEFHTPGGCHYKTRIPRYGRDLLYDRRSAEALIPTAGVNSDGLGEVFRLNLELGRFMKAYEVDVGGDDTTSVGAGTLQGGINAGSVNTGAIAQESHNLMAFGTSIGTVEFWDSRSKSRAGLLSLPPATNSLESSVSEVTALQFQRSGLTLATGDSSGLIHLYDLRSPAPLLKKNQGYGYPIQNLMFLDFSSSSRAQNLDSKILSADKRIIKIWDRQTGQPWTSVEPAVDINHVEWCRDSGMLLTANEGRQQHAFFIPQLGPAPKWCAFLDNLVEELAEDPNDPNAFGSQKVGEVYDNYKFLTLPQLRQLNIDHLVGRTGLLRPYMHGFFVSQRLYEEAALISNPDMWQEQRAKSIKAKIDKERESRIRGKKKTQVKVNRKLAEKLMELEEKNERRRARRVLANGGDEDKVDTEAAQTAIVEPESENPAPSGGLLNDSRFSKLFEDEDFEIDGNNDSISGFDDRKIPKGLTAAEEEELEELEASDDSADSNDSSEPAEAVHDGISKKNMSNGSRSKRNPHSKGSSQGPRMVVSSSNARRPQMARDKSFGSRAATLKDSRKEPRRNSRIGVVGEREVTFAPTRNGNNKKPQQEAPGPENRPRYSKDRRSASGNAFRRM